MQYFTLEQLRTTQEAGAVEGVTLTGEGAAFEMKVKTPRGVAVLVKTKKAGSEPTARRFVDPRQAMTLLNQLGIVTAVIETKGWRPDEPASDRVRPDRKAHLQQALAALDHQRWVESVVADARAGLADGTNERYSPEEWDAIRAEKRRARG